MLGVRQGDKDDIGATNGFAGGNHFESLFLCDWYGLTALVKSNEDFQSAVFKVQRVGMSLGAEAKHGERFVLERVEIGIFVSVNFSRHLVLFRSLS